MITLFHGEDVTASRNALPEGAVKVDGKTATPELLAQMLSGNNLFDGWQTVVIENPKKIPEMPPDIDVFIWFDHKLTATQLKAYSGAQVQEFKLGTIVFKFVESLRPGNRQEMVNLFEQYSRSELPEIILTMIIRQFRLMLDPSSLAGWQKDRIVAQSKQFPPEKIKKIYKELLDIDYRQKTGLAPSDLSGSLELFLLTL